MDLLEMQGVSMAPWLQPGDVLLVDPSVLVNQIRVGDVVVLRHRTEVQSVAHRVVAFPLITKGDRNACVDPLTHEWDFVGKVVKVRKNGIWKKPKYGKLLAWVSRRGFYPGQKFPLWLSRTQIRKKFTS